MFTLNFFKFTTSSLENFTLSAANWTVLIILAFPLLLKWI